MEKKHEPDSNTPNSKSSKEDIFRPIEQAKNPAESGSTTSDKSSQETEHLPAQAKPGGFSSQDKTLELGVNKAQEKISSAKKSNSRQGINPTKIDGDLDNNNESPDSNRSPASGSQSPTPNISDLYKIPTSPLKGKYEFIKVIGAGGAGVIYKAKQNPLGRIVAIKMVHSHIVSERSLKRFEQEARTISNLVHPNIISIHDFGVSEDDQPYMVMDYIEGEPLSEYIKRNNRLSIDETVDYACQICDGLSHAHAKGILHRDLKPNNIMLVPLETGDNHIKILDFGLAKLLDEQDNPQDHLTKTGETVGTPAYMSPEQVMGKNMDKRTDIYSLGCVMYHCLTGSPPFIGETKMETMLMHLNQAPLPVNEFAGEELLDPLFDAMILKLLAKDPSERYNSLQEVKDSIVATQKGLFIGTLIDKNVSEPAEVETKQVAESDLSKLTDIISENKVVSISILLFCLLAIPLGSLVINLNKPVKQFSKEEVIEKAKPLELELIPNDIFNRNIDILVKKDDQTRQQKFASKGLQISDDALTGLKRLHNLYELLLDGSPVTDRGIEYLLPYKGIHELSLKKTKITDKGLKYLSKLPKLKILSLEDTEITDNGMTYLGQCKSLLGLNLSNTKITGKNFKQLASLSNLDRLNLSNTKITNNNLDSLKDLKNLTQLIVSNTAISDPGIKKISKIKSLRKLDIDGTKITKEALNYIGDLKYIGSLNLSRTDLDDSCLINLKKIKGLDRLKLVDCDISQVTIGKYLENERQCKIFKYPE